MLKAQQATEKSFEEFELLALKNIFSVPESLQPVGCRAFTRPLSIVQALRCPLRRVIAHARGAASSL